ncbi:unnamed protein product [Fraxinus pennsylvanica]|uniref:Pectinesterase inhibitor domain-containing protein n=1 Tax=Fraxinus pennsylvanica TaxID=56036 RepID=A0AAD2DIY0_9LAMI|nr:unnamed protein product [Fraxinus pennsylvanica]
MASGSFFFSTLSLAFLCSFLTFDNVKADLIGDLCSKTSNPSSCDEVLRSDPRSVKADLRGLGEIAIDKAITSAKTSLNLVKALAKGRIQSKCIEYYFIAFNSLNKCQSLILGKDKLNLYAEAANADINIFTCDALFYGKEPIFVKQASQKTRDIINIIETFSNLP